MKQKDVVNIAPWLLRSKVTPPRQLMSVVDRPRLIKTIDDAINGKLLILQAPGGYGKSSVLSEWSEKRKARGDIVAWLSVDEDDDADALIAYIAFACLVAGLDMQDATLLQFDYLADKKINQAVYQLLAQVEQSPSPIHIIIDDFERLNESVRNSVFKLLLRRLPDNATLIVASREPVGLETIDLEHRGLVKRMQSSDLRFNKNEITNLWGTRISNLKLQQIEKKTQGWPVFVRLLLAAADMGIFDVRQLDEVSYSDQLILEYFDKKIYTRLDEDLRQLLIQTSIYDEVSTEIAEQAMGEAFHDALLSKLDTVEAFCVPLSDDGSVKGHRLHPMMRDFLRYKFKSEDLLGYQEANRKAALWYMENGNHVRALKHALHVENIDLIEKVIDHSDSAFLWLREGMIQLRLIDKYVPEELIGKNPTATFIKVINLVKTGKPSEAALLLEESCQQFGDTKKWREATVARAICQCMTDLYRGRAINQEDLALIENHFSKNNPHEPVLRGFTETMRGFTEHQTMQFSKFSNSADKAITAFRATGSHFGEVYIHFHSAMVAGLKGDNRESKKQFLEASQIIRRHLSYDEGIKTIRDVLQFEIEHERNPESSKQIPRLRNISMKLFRLEGWLDIYCAAFRTLSEKIMHKAGSQEALTILDSALGAATANKFEFFPQIVMAQKAIILKTAGFISESENVIDSLIGDYERIMSSYKNNIPWRYSEAVAEAVLLDARNLLIRPKLGWITTYPEHALGCGNKRTALRVYTASIHKVMQDHPENLESRLDIIEMLLAETRYARSVLQHSDALRSALKIHNKPGTNKYKSIFSTLSDARKTTQDKGTFDDASIFSEKEKAVLAELQKGGSDKVIASALNVTEHTVRYHLKKIYAKLNVSNRLEAVRRAEKLGLESLD